MTTDPLAVPPSAVAALAETLWHDAVVAPLDVPGATSVRFEADDYARIGERLEILLEHLPTAWSAPLVPLLARKVATMIATTGRVGLRVFTTLEGGFVGSSDLFSHTLKALADDGVGLACLAPLNAAYLKSLNDERGTSAEAYETRTYLSLLGPADSAALAAAIAATPAPLPLCLTALLCHTRGRRDTVEGAVLARYLADYPDDPRATLALRRPGAICRPLAKHLIETLPDSTTAPETAALWRRLLASPLGVEGYRALWTRLAPSLSPEEQMDLATALPLVLRAEFGLVRPPQPRRGPTP